MINREEHLYQHISNQFNAELKELKNHLMTMGGLVETQVTDAIRSLLDADVALAEQVRRRDDDVDELEMVIDEECTRVIATRQPAASDLRMVIAVARMVTELERIGDEAEKIAKNAIRIDEEGATPRGYTEVRHIGNHVTGMLRDALDAFARLDLDQAIRVMREDKLVDEEYGSAMRALVTFMMEDPRNISAILSVMWVLRAMERIGDHARNLCEHVIYMVRGRDVRHSSLEAAENIVHGKRG